MVGFGSGIDLDGDDLAVCADGDGPEGLLGEFDVAEGGNDGGVWASNEGGQESFNLPIPLEAPVME